MNRQYWATSLTLLFFLVILSSCQSSPERERLAKDYYNIGNAYFDLEQYDKAVEYYDRALQLDPTINQAVFNMARTKIETGDFRRALKLLNRLLESDPENVMVLEMIAYTYYRMDSFPQAVDLYKRILVLNPYNKKALYNISILEVELERFDLARLHLQKLQEQEDKSEYRKLLADIAREEGDSEAAIGLYESIVAEDKASGDVYTALKELYLEEQRYSDVLTVFDELVESSENGSEKADLLFERARIEFLYLEDMVLGQEHLIQALQLGFGSGDSSSLESLTEELDSPVKEQVEKIIDENLMDPEPEESEKKELEVGNSSDSES